MKYRLIGVFSATLFLMACGGNKAEHQKYKDVSAFYTGMDGGEMRFRCTVNNPSEEKLYVVVNGKEHAFDVQKKNQVDTTFTGVVPQISTITYASIFYPLYFANGEVGVEISDSQDHPQPAKHSGTYRAVNEYLNSGIRTPGKLLFNRNEEELKKGTEEYLAEAKAKLDGTDFPSVFKKLQGGRLLYLMYAEWPQYGYDHAWMTGVEKYVPTELYFDELEYLAEERKDYFILDAYRRFLVTAIPVLAAGKTTGLSPKETTQKGVEYVVKNYKDPLLVQHLIDELIAAYVETYGQDVDLAALHAKYVGEGTKLETSREKTVVADCLFKDSRGKEVKFADLKDKFVYVMVWDSETEGMDVQFEALKKVEEQFAKRSIAFVAVYCDKDEAAWKDALKQLNPIGEQWRMAEDGSFAEMLSIRRTPRYLLLDPKGHVVQDAMPAPTESGFEMLIAELLEMGL